MSRILKFIFVAILMISANLAHAQAVYDEFGDELTPRVNRKLIYTFYGIESQQGSSGPGAVSPPSGGVECKGENERVCGQGCCDISKGLECRNNQCVSKCTKGRIWWQGICICPDGTEWSTIDDRCVETCKEGYRWSSIEKKCVEECPGQFWSPLLKKCVACMRDLDCVNHTWKFCNTYRGECVECINSEDCPNNQTCVDYTCRCPGKHWLARTQSCVDCLINAHCPTGMVCNGSNKCVECVVNADCPVSKACVNSKCVEKSCESKNDCWTESPFCGDNRKCIRCLTDSNCPGGGHCTGGDCSCPSGQYWSTVLWRCVDCLEDAHCTGGKICSNYACECPIGLIWSEETQHCECPNGQVYSPITKTCECPEDKPIWVESEKMCVECVRNTDCPDTQICDKYECKCPEGTVLSPTTGLCECTGGRIWDSVAQVCVCPAGLIWNETAQVCECPEDLPHFLESEQRCVECLIDPHCVSNQICTKEYVCDCPIGLIWSTITERCECPSDKIYDEATGQCVCPPEQVEINGICQCPEGTYPSKGHCCPRYTEWDEVASGNGYCCPIGWHWSYDDGAKMGSCCQAGQEVAIVNGQAVCQLQCAADEHLTSGHCCKLDQEWSEISATDGSCCLTGYHWSRNAAQGVAMCCPPDTEVELINGAAVCTKQCPSGEHLTNGHCCLIGEEWYDDLQACAPCPSGEHLTNGHCCPNDQIWDDKTGACAVDCDIHPELCCTPPLMWNGSLCVECFNDADCPNDYYCDDSYGWGGWCQTCPPDMVWNGAFCEQMCQNQSECTWEEYYDGCYCMPLCPAGGYPNGMGGCDECLNDGHCASGFECVAGNCVEKPICQDANTCAWDEYYDGCYCMPLCPAGGYPNGAGGCDECLNDGHCPSGFECVAGNCMEKTICQDANTCAWDEYYDGCYCMPLCPAGGYPNGAGGCDECLNDSHCPSGFECAAGNCQQKDPCPGQHEQGGICVDCLTDAHCPSGYTCLGGVCWEDMNCQNSWDCTPEEIFDGCYCIWVGPPDCPFGYWNGFECVDDWDW